MRPLIRLLLMVLISSTSVSCAVVDRYTGEDVNGPVRKNGVAASAQVLKIWDTGVRLNDNPVIGFRLLVTPENGRPYEAETKQVISIIDIPQVQPGAILPVKIDPQDPEKVALGIREGR